jgi:hypothetical protein
MPQMPRMARATVAADDDGAAAVVVAAPIAPALK